MHFTLDQGLFDLMLIMVGFIGRSILPLKIPAMLLCLLIDMTKWYLKTHPHGKQMAKYSGVNEKLQKLYPDAVG